MISHELRALERRSLTAERIEDWLTLAHDALDVAERQHALMIFLSAELDTERWHSASDALHRYLSGHD